MGASLTATRLLALPNNALSWHFCPLYTLSPPRFITLDCSNLIFTPYNTHPKILKFSASIPRYSDLNWRLDVEVSSRTRAQAVTPSFVLQLNTVSGSMGDSKDQVLMTSDYANMQHMRTELAAAVAAMKSTRALRVTRYLQ